MKAARPILFCSDYGLADEFLNLNPEAPPSWMVRFYKALSDEKRLRILRRLSDAFRRQDWFTVAVETAAPDGAALGRKSHDDASGRRRTRTRKPRDRAAPQTAVPGPRTKAAAAENRMPRPARR